MRWGTARRAEHRRPAARCSRERREVQEACGYADEWREERRSHADPLMSGGRCTAGAPITHATNVFWWLRIVARVRPLYPQSWASAVHSIGKVRARSARFRNRRRRFGACGIVARDRAHDSAIVAGGLVHAESWHAARRTLPQLSRAVWCMRNRGTRHGARLRNLLWWPAAPLQVCYAVPGVSA